MFQKNVEEKIKTFFVQKNRALYEIMCKNIVEIGRPNMTISRMYIAFWITVFTNTHLENVILVAFPLQQWFHELSSILRYTYLAGSVFRYRQLGEGLQRLPLKSSTDYLTFRGPCTVIYFYNKSQRHALFLKFI
jgi:hypothetical protein